MKHFSVALFAVSLSACAVEEQDELSANAGADPTTLAQELGARSPNDRVIFWQQNIEGMKAAAAPASLMSDAMMRFTYRPDIVLMEEAWQRSLCGRYLDPASETDPALSNYKLSAVDARGLARTCGNGSAPLPGSVLARLGTHVWGGLANVGQRRPFTNTLGQHSRTGTTIAWDQSRFTLEDDFVFDDSDVPGCSTALESYKRIAVLLRDTRRTTSTSDDQLIAVASVHYGSSCPGSNDRYVAEQMLARWSTWHGRPLAMRVVGGDFNARADETSASYVQRRREEHPTAWYTAFAVKNLWAGGRFTDTVKAVHGGTGDDADLCAQWTYPNVGSCAAKTACSSLCSGFGIGGKLDRLDYLFVAAAHGPLPASRIISAETDDHSFGYSDHKAVRVSIRWE